jgi:putative ABC transport system permease protein
LPRPLLLSLRNTFRRKGRLALTLTTLVMGGAIFIAVFAVRASLLLTLDDMFKYVDYDVYLGFNRAYRVEQIERLAKEVPGVKAAETWRFETARRVRADDTESENVIVYGPPAESALVQPYVVEGRWLLPGDQNAVVVNTLFLKDEKDVKVGDTITLTMSGKDLEWNVVGVVSRTPPIAMAYTNLPYLAKQMGGVGRGGVVFVVTDQRDAASQMAMAQTLEQHFEDNGLKVGQTQTSSTERGQITSQFNLLVMFLLIMAILLAVVGGIGLMGTMSLNVMERTREIGVLRAIGATDRSIFMIVVVEGIIIGLLSALIGTALAYPLSLGMSNAVGNSILKANLSYTFAPFGVGLWLVVVLALATLASLLPARSASRVTVREVLAYE